MRRIEIARTLLHRPSLLLLDEATVGLDIQSRAGILATIRKLVETERIGVLWATHLIDEVDNSDDVVVLRQGKLVTTGKVSDVVKTSGTGSIRAAFSKLSGIDAAGMAEISR
jgi:ABC-2 type transport system ATP-binding protein